MLDDAMARLLELDRTLDGPTVTRALAVDLGGRDRPLHDRTDPVVVTLRAGLVDLLVQPRQLTRSGHPSRAAQRRAVRCHRCFDEGYLVGRIGFDTHRLPLLWSGMTGAGTTAATNRLILLRSVTLSPALAGVYAGTEHLAPLLRDLTEETRGIPAELAAQFAALGLLAAVAEWSLLVDDHDRHVALVPADC